MKYLFIILAVICGSLLLTGCAGTRFTEMLWAVGTEEDYLVFSENRANILYQYGNDYYVKCEKITCQERPGFWCLIAPPSAVLPNRYKLVKKHPGTLIARISEANFKEAIQNEPIYPQTLLKNCEIVSEIPSGAQAILPEADNFIHGHLINAVYQLGVRVSGTKISERKSAASYCLLPFMLPTLCVDAATYLCWPLNFAVGIIALKYEDQYRTANPISNHCYFEQRYCPR